MGNMHPCPGGFRERHDCGGVAVLGGAVDPFDPKLCADLPFVHDPAVHDLKVFRVADDAHALFLRLPQRFQHQGARHR